MPASTPSDFPTNIFAPTVPPSPTEEASEIKAAIKTLEGSVVGSVTSVSVRRPDGSGWTVEFTK